MIGFNEIPATLRVPFVFVEFNNANAVQNATVKPYRLLVIGQRLAAGTVLANQKTRVTSAAQAKTYFGAGSMLAQMVEKLIKVNNFTETICIAVDDDAAGVKATGTISFTGPAVQPGTVALYIGGRRFTVGVNAADTATVIATAVAAAINAKTDLPVTAAAALGVVTLTAKHKGAAGSGIDVRANYNVGEAFPAGVAAVIVKMNGGTANPDLAAAIAALGDTQFDVIAFPYTDAVSLASVEGELADRWGPMRQIEGVAIAATMGDLTAQGTLGDSRNSPHVSILGAYGVASTPWEVAAVTAGVIAYYGNIDPARQFKTLPLVGLLPPTDDDVLRMEERNLALYDGISTFVVDAGGVMRIERMITTYKTSAAGADDPSYLDLTTPLLLGYIRYDWRNYILRKYPRHKLANDGTRYGAGQPIITPKIGKAEAVAKFRQWEDMGLVENAEQFKRDLICERNPNDPNRLDWVLPPDLINNFMVGGTQIAFLLQGSPL